VEKPAALSVAELEIMLRTCRDHQVFLMEAFMYRFMAVHNRAREIVAGGQSGRSAMSISTSVFTSFIVSVPASVW